MKLYVHKYPDSVTMARCTEVADDAGVPAPPFELMTLAEFAAWKAEPAQVQWRVDKVAAEVAAQAAKDADVQNDRTVVQTVLAASQAMIDGVGTAAERQRRVELGLGRLLQYLAKRKRDLFEN